MKRLLILGVAFAALAADTDFNFTTSANAAEMERARPAARRAAPAARPAAQAPAANWTGGQAGGNGGGASGAQSFVDPPFICPGVTFGVSCFASPFSFSGSPGSFTGGGFLGYRWQMGGMVVGVETDVSWKKLETTYNQSTFAIFGGSPRTEFFQGSIKQGWDASFRVRGGYLVTPWTLAYITGGLAIGEVSGSFAYSGVLPGTICGVATCFAAANASWNDTRVGGTVGGGLEQALGPFWKARVEYRYTDFGKYSKTLGVASNCVAGTCTASGSTTVDLRAAFHKVTAGIGFDF